MITAIDDRTGTRITHTYNTRLIISCQHRSITSIVHNFSTNVRHILRISLTTGTDVSTRIYNLGTMIIIFNARNKRTALPIQPPLFGDLSFHFVLLCGFDHRRLRQTTSRIRHTLSSKTLALTPVAQFSLSSVATTRRLRRSNPFKHILLRVP